MMNPKTPGVYINEIPSLPPSVAGVETAIPVFIGYTRLHDANVPADTVTGGHTVTHPTRIESLLDYRELFGGSQAKIMVSVKEVNNELEIIGALANPPKYMMDQALRFYFLNGGGPCYIISVSDFDPNSVAKARLEKGIEMLEKVDEPTLVLFPDLEEIGGGTQAVKAANYYGVYQSAIDHCAIRKDRFVLVDVYSKGNGVANTSEVEVLRDKLTDNLSYAAAYYPRVSTTLYYLYDDSQVIFAQTIPAAAPYEGKTLAEVKADLALSTPAFANSAKGMIFAIEVAAKAAASGLDNPVMQPSSALAGIYVANDASRGVWQAPANVGIRGSIEVEKKFSPSELDNLNVHSTGKSVNAIRPISGRGITVMGARTLDGNSNEWRYIQVRRLFIYVEESINKALGSFVFDANDANTWARAKGMISNFLESLWRDGALTGAKAEDAYFVNVGLGLTMTSQDIIDGYMKINVGIASARTAEFIILEFSHKLAVS